MSAPAVGTGRAHSVRVRVLPASRAFSTWINHEHPCFVAAGPVGWNVTTFGVCKVALWHASAPGSRCPPQSLCPRVHARARVFMCVLLPKQPPPHYKPVHMCVWACVCPLGHTPPPSVCGRRGSALGPDACERRSGSRRSLAGGVPTQASCPPPLLATSLAYVTSPLCPQPLRWPVDPAEALSCCGGLSPPRKPARSPSWLLCLHLSGKAAQPGFCRGNPVPDPAAVCHFASFSRRLVWPHRGLALPVGPMGTEVLGHQLQALRFAQGKCGALA